MFNFVYSLCDLQCVVGTFLLKGVIEIVFWVNSHLVTLSIKWDIHLAR